MEREGAGKTKATKFRGLVHWLFVNQNPSIFRIALTGHATEWQGAIPLGLDSIGVETTTNSKMTVHIDPNSLKFGENKTFTDWKTPHLSKVNFLDTVVAPEKMNQIYFRFRLCNAQCNIQEKRLRMEMMVLPAGTTFASLSGPVLDIVNSAHFPATAVAVKFNPVSWRNDVDKKLHGQFTTPIFFVEAAEDQELRYNTYDPRVPNIDSHCHARLLYEVEKQMAAGCTIHSSPAQQLKFWKKVEQNNCEYPSNTRPLLVLGNKAPAINYSDVEEVEDESRNLGK